MTEDPDLKRGMHQLAVSLIIFTIFTIYTIFDTANNLNSNPHYIRTGVTTVIYLTLIGSLYNIHKGVVHGKE